MTDEEANSEILRKIIQDIDRILHENKDGCGVGCVVHPSTDLIYMLACERTFHIEIEDENIVVSNYTPRLHRPWRSVAQYSLADPHCFEKVIDKAFELKRLKERSYPWTLKIS